MAEAILLSYVNSKKSARAEAFADFNKRNIETPAIFTSFPEPMMIYPMVALFVSTIVNIVSSPNLCCGPCRNLQGCVNGICCCGGKFCDFRRACSRNDGCCDWGNMCDFSCGYKCSEAGLVHQIVFLILAWYGLMWSIFKKLLSRPETKLSGDNVNTTGLKIKKTPDIVAFIPPVLALTLASWSLAYKPLRENKAALTFNIVTIVVSIASTVVQIMGRGHVFGKPYVSIITPVGQVKSEAVAFNAFQQLFEQKLKARRLPQENTKQ